MCDVQGQDKLASLQREMRAAPLGDPNLPRGVALSQALAKELSLLFCTVSQRVCFAQLAAAALYHRLHQQRLPDGLLAVSHSPAESSLKQMESQLALETFVDHLLDNTQTETA